MDYSLLLAIETRQRDSCNNRFTNQLEPRDVSLAQMLEAWDRHTLDSEDLT